jgi:hypothetical protein
VARAKVATTGRGSQRLLVPLAAAAAVLSIAFTGVSVVAMHARPGDTLWPLATVLYSDHARSVKAAASAQYELNTASSAMRAGRVSDARAALQRASEALGKVSVEDGLSELAAKHDTLRAQLETTTPERPGPSNGGSVTTVSNSASSVMAVPPVTSRPEPDRLSSRTTVSPESPTSTATTTPASAAVTTTQKTEGSVVRPSGRSSGELPARTN